MSGDVLDFYAATETLRTMDPHLQPELVFNDPPGTTRLVVRDTSRHCYQTWTIDNLPIQLIQLNAVKKYFDRARKRHPESYETCACHKEASLQRDG